ncbi:MAG: cupin domain-containing protein [Bauldia sp.]
MKTLRLAASILVLGSAAIGPLAGLAIAQGTPPAPVSSPLQDAAVSGQPGLHAVTVIVDWPVGAATVTHTHPGDEYAVVIEGELTLWAEGQADRVITAGQAYYNPRGLVHGARNSGTVPARSVITFIADVGVPTLTPVTP